jgi:hypothetical protein
MGTSNNGDTASEQTLPKPTKESFWSLVQQHRKANTIAFLALMIQACSLAISLIGILFVIFQIRNVRESLDSQSYGSINDKLNQIDMVFIQAPELRPYFFDNARWPDEKTAKDKLTAVAEARLDLMDYWFRQASHMNLEAYDMMAWRTFFTNSFQRSQILCDVLRTEQNEYGEPIRSLAQKSGYCPGVTPRDPKSLDRLEEYFPPLPKS